MKTLNLLGIVFAVFIGNLNAQVQIRGDIQNLKIDTVQKKILDNAGYRAYYSMEFVADSLSPRSKARAQTVLLIGSKHSSFLDYNALRNDSVNDAMVRNHASVSEIFSKTMSIRALVKIRTVIIKHYPDRNKYLFQQNLFTETYNYPDEIDIQWTLIEEEKEIAGYKCLKASCDYRGRHYFAWYAPEIPVGEGPHVFSGLPGLILEIADSREHYHFKINGFTPVKGYDPVYIPAGGVMESTRDKVRKAVANLHADPASMIRNSEQLKNVIGEEAAAKSSPRPYNPIELE
jgi:GLPGLI family protein